MQHHPFQALFMSRYDIEHFTPPPRAALISIADNENDKAKIDPSKWSGVYYHFFIDAGYDEESLSFGQDFDQVYADYITPEKAQALRQDIEKALGTGPDLVVINCHAGRSRSAAVAQYLSERYGAKLTQETNEANQTVFRLLRFDRSLLDAIESSRNDKNLGQNPVQDEQPAPTGFIVRLLNLFGVDTSPR